MEREILLPNRIQRSLSAEHKCSENELNRALKYQRNSPRAKRLRRAAIERGGLIFTGERKPQGFMPDADTRFDHSEEVMYQKFGNRVELQVSRKTNTATVFIDGELVATFENYTMRDWQDSVYSLQQIYNKLISQ